MEDKLCRTGDPIRWFCLNQRSSISEERNDGGLYWKSEGFILLFEGERQHNDTRGKEPCFIHATEEEMAEMIASC
jgi:hypothetical protein